MTIYIGYPLQGFRRGRERDSPAGSGNSQNFRDLGLALCYGYPESSLAVKPQGRFRRGPERGEMRHPVKRLSLS